MKRHVLTAVLLVLLAGLAQWRLAGAAVDASSRGGAESLPPCPKLPALTASWTPRASPHTGLEIRLPASYRAVELTPPTGGDECVQLPDSVGGLMLAYMPHRGALFEPMPPSADAIDEGDCAGLIAGKSARVRRLATTEFRPHDTAFFWFVEELGESPTPLGAYVGARSRAVRDSLAAAVASAVRPERWLVAGGGVAARRLHATRVASCVRARASGTT